MSEIVYICSPYRGSEAEIIKHLKYARELVKREIMTDCVPICPHLYLPQVLDDRKADERALGLLAGLELLRACDVVLVGNRYGITEGMAAEIERARELGKPVYYTNVLKPTGSFYCWGTDEPLMDIYSDIIKPLIAQQRATFRNLITWDKGNGQGQRSANTRKYATADEKCLFIMCGKQGGENNQDSYSEAWEPVRLYIVTELEKLGVKSGQQYEAIHGSTNKSQHHLSKSHFALMTREDYERLQAFAQEKGVAAFTRSYDDLAAEYESTRAYFDNLHDNMNNVWHFTRATPRERLLTGGHPTPKPLALCERAIKTSSREGELVLDFFGGSGSTLIAAERLRRSCYVCELLPSWCDVIVRRWETITGEKATRIS